MQGVLQELNIADIYHPGDPPIVMPPLNPPAGCEDKMEQRKDDTEEVVKARLQVYKDNSVPVEEFYRTAGMPQTLRSRAVSLRRAQILNVILDIVRSTPK